MSHAPAVRDAAKELMANARFKAKMLRDVKPQNLAEVPTWLPEVADRMDALCDTLDALLGSLPAAPSGEAVNVFADRVVRVIDGHRKTTPWKAHVAYDECLSLIRREAVSAASAPTAGTGSDDPPTA